MTKKTVGIIGHTGMVGKTVMAWFLGNETEVYGYSLDDIKNKTKAFNADVVFVAVPTPFHFGGGGYDDSIVDESLSQIGEGRIVVIKSTVKVGTTDKLQKKYPKLKLLFNPEFLSEATCYQDFNSPDRQFVGYTSESYDVAMEVLHLLPESPADFILPAKEAELLKFINNLHGIMEIMESNHYYDVCQKEGLNYDRVCRAMITSKWVSCPMGRHYRVIYHKGKRGFGGKCFPKDLNSWLEYCKDNGIDARIFQSARDYNESLLKVQGLTEELAEKIGTEEDAKRILGGL